MQIIIVSVVFSYCPGCLLIQIVLKTTKTTEDNKPPLPPPFQRRGDADAVGMIDVRLLRYLCSKHGHTSLFPASSVFVSC